MYMVNPFEETVVFGKAYPVAWPPPSSTRIRALLPTGAHIGHANALHVVHSSAHSGGPATRLERYTKGKVKKGAAGEAWRGMSGFERANAVVGGASLAAIPVGVHQGNRAGRAGNAKWSDSKSVARRAFQPGYNDGAMWGNHKRLSAARAARAARADRAAAVGKADGAFAAELTRVGRLGQKSRNLRTAAGMQYRAIPQGGRRAVNTALVGGSAGAGTGAVTGHRRRTVHKADGAFASELTRVGRLGQKTRNLKTAAGMQYRAIPQGGRAAINTGLIGGSAGSLAGSVASSGNQPNSKNPSGPARGRRL